MPLKKIALITGISGQDGSYLSELLLEKNYKVYGILRRQSSINTKRIDHIFDRLVLFHGDMTDQSSLQNIFDKIEKENEEKVVEVFEVYNLAAQSHVKVSFEVPEYTAQVDALGTLRLLETIVKSKLKDKIKFYQASTSELYGKVLEIPQNEKTPFNPQSPYAIAKLYSYWVVKNYKEAYGLFACNGILFNHTSPRRGETFVCRKIAIGVADIYKGKIKHLTLGNLNSKRDLGHAQDYVYGMWLMLQNKSPEDYVLSMNKTYSVKEIVEICFKNIGREILWEGEGLNEVGKDKVSGDVIVKVSEKHFRPCEVDLLFGDSSKARKEIGWVPKYDTENILKEIVLEELKYY